LTVERHPPIIVLQRMFTETAEKLVHLANYLHARGWLSGTSGNLSALLEHEPLRLAITPSGADKGELTADDILLIDQHSQLQSPGSGKPSDESPLHVAVVKSRDAGCVIHTHSIWSTVLSDIHKSDSGLNITGFEMLKGLRGVTTHLHREFVPMIENSQDMLALTERVTRVLDLHPEAHAFILRRHGLYTWGRDLREAKRHVEILEFLFEVLGRTETR
jgi:methylthioribulose-1-phosphate dehydratase